jgi:ADP-ribose pyrophosphatase YjhB (NUDIX family)
MKSNMKFLVRFGMTVLMSCKKLYWSIAKPRTYGAKALMLNEKDEVLLVQPTYHKQWSLPGGGMKAEEEPMHALRRELQEELNIEIPEVEAYLGTYHRDEKSKCDTVHCFAMRVNSDTMMIPDGIEVSDVAWKPITFGNITPFSKKIIEENTDMSHL